MAVLRGLNHTSKYQPCVISSSDYLVRAMVTGECQVPGSLSRRVRIILPLGWLYRWTDYGLPGTCT